eukprot:5411421-Pleurochrysis_carterae.AAC.1
MSPPYHYQSFYHLGGRKTTNYYKYNQSRSGASAGAGTGTRLRGGSKRVARQGSGDHRENGFPRAWGAERSRSASTHAMRMQIGKPCI